MLIFSGKPREAPYIPPAPSENETEIFAGSVQKGINFDRYDDIPVEVSGRDQCGMINTFDEADLLETFLANVKKAGYERPTPIQKYALPIISGGRDLMACAQTGSGKTVSFSDNIPVFKKNVGWCFWDQIVGRCQRLLSCY